MDWLWHAIKHSLILLPFLFASYVIIELIENAFSDKINHKFFKGKFAPLIGASFGIVPQCGFSVVATDLYSQKKISVGTLIAIYIATSDEAIPILISNLNNSGVALKLVLLIAVKFIFGVACGYFVDWIISLKNKRTPQLATNLNNQADAAIAGAHNEQDDTSNEHTNSQNLDNHDEHIEHQTCACDEHNDQITAHIEEDAQDEQEHAHHKGCCGHDIEESKAHPAKQYLLHPLIHTLKVFAYILIVNIVFELILHFVGEDNLSVFLQSSYYFAPLIACLIGLIPNCASSVVLTNLLVLGGLSFSACIAGLIVNAGIAYLVLFKQNKNQQHNLAILGTMFAIGLATGYILMIFGI